jgi:hypothetical protein
LLLLLLPLPLAPYVLPAAAVAAESAASSCHTSSLMRLVMMLGLSAKAKTSLKMGLQQVGSSK